MPSSFQLWGHEKWTVPANTPMKLPMHHRFFFYGLYGFEIYTRKQMSIVAVIN